METRINDLELPDQRLVRALELVIRRDAAPVKRGRDWDAYAAVIASLIGILALAVAGYTAYVQRQQLRAQIWPHLQLEFSGVNLNFHAVNQGTGPARVTAMRVTVGGVPVKTWADVEKQAGFVAGEGLISSWLSRAVVPPGKDFLIVEPANNEPSRARAASLLPGGPHNLSITVCYCSVLEDCWTTTLNVEEDDTPSSRASCPILATERFTQ